MPAEQLDEFNQNILGIMDVVAEFRPERSSKEWHRLRVYAHLLANWEIFFERKGSIEATIVALWQAPHGLWGHRHFWKDLPQPGAKDQRSLIEHYWGIPLA
jgi:hypothetical protein